MKYIFLLLLLLPLNTSLSQVNLQLYGVNGWDFFINANPPYLYDTLNTGMALELDSLQNDTVQRFEMNGPSSPIGNEFVFAPYFAKTNLHEIYPWPDSVSVNINILGTLNVEYLQIDIKLTDTVNSRSVFSSYWVTIQPGWQSFKTSFIWPGHEGEYVHEIALGFSLYTAIQTDCGLILWTNDLEFIKDGNHTLVDPFQLQWPTNVIESISNLIPTGFTLYQNYPNPFNPTTKIRYEVPEYSSVKLNIYSLLGEEVSELINKEQPPGIYEVDFDGKNLPSGIYIYALSINGQRVNSRKMLLIK